MLIVYPVIYCQAQDSVSAESINPKYKKARATKLPVITKGYYSIYKNNEKLAVGSPLKIVTNPVIAEGSPAKGYYSIGNNQRNIYKGGESFISKTPQNPSANKGYYSIDRSSGKTKENDTLVAIQVITNDSASANN